VLDAVGANALEGDLGVLLGRQHHGVHAHRTRRSYSTVTWDLPSGRSTRASHPPHRGQPARQAMRQHEWMGMSERVWAAGVPEHESLVAGNLGSTAALMSGDCGAYA